MALIVDAQGKPYSRPTKPLDVPASVGVTNPATRWGSVASCITADRAAAVLRAAKQGNAEAYLTLAEELEERDLHYASLIQTRKFAVSGEEIEILPGDSSARAKRAAEKFKEDVAELDIFDAMLFDCMDAVAKGYSVIQPHWDVSSGQAQFNQFEWCDPRLFRFDRVNLRELRLADGTENGRELPPGQFFVHYPRIKTGIRLRGGVAMLATIAHVSKSFTLSSWLAFCEVYGMPLRVANYDPEVMTQPEIDALKIALANIGHDAAALVPHGASIEILDARRPATGESNIYEGLANYWDAQLSKAILGQTMTTDDGSSKAQADVHDRVRLDIRRADAKAICATVRKGVIEPWTRFNFGPHVAVPKMRIAVDPPEDLVAFTNALVPWIEKGGLKVRASEVREKFGLSDPAEAPEGEEILGGLNVGEQDMREEIETKKEEDDAKAAEVEKAKKSAKPSKGKK